MSMIELVDIDKELKRQWDEARGEKKTRASLFNLIIYAKKNERAGYYQDLVKSVVSKFPCRVILVMSDDSATEHLKTSVRSETIGTGSNQIFCEIITIEVAGSLKERVYFVMLPHLLPDLPIYLLWTKDPALKSDLLPRLEKIATRIIFDSEETSNITEYAQTTLGLLQRFHCEIGDLNWSALSGWRKIMSDFFDSEDNYHLLQKAKKVEITFVKNKDTTHRHSEIEAAYLQSWLAAILHWRFHSFDEAEGHLRLSYETMHGVCNVFLTGKPLPALHSGALLTVEVATIDDGVDILFQRQRETRQVLIKYSDQERCDLPHCSYLPGIEEGKEIIEEIFYPSGRDHYRKMLEMLSQIPWSS